MVFRQIILSSLVTSYSLWEPANHLRCWTDTASLEQPTVSMVRLVLTLDLEDADFATQKMNVTPGLPSTLERKSMSNGSRFSIDLIAVGIGLNMSVSRSQTSFQRPARSCCWALFSAPFVDLLLMDNT